MKNAVVLNEDFLDMISALQSEGVEFLLVGGYAVSLYGYPRATKDIDFFIRRSADNATRVLRALKTFGAPLRGLDEQTLQQADVGFQIGVAPCRIDFLTSISGVEFADAWNSRQTHIIDGHALPVIGLAELLKNKHASGRPQDLVDAAELEARVNEKSG